MSPLLQTILLLILSNCFMTFAWYGHLKNLSASPWYVAAMISWGIALFEYMLQVPANRIGVQSLTLSQLKIIQDGQSFAFSLDTLLLAYWAKEAIKNRSKVVELCSGNAAASLYMAAFNKAHYDDVELQEDMVSKARRSVELNDMQDRITVYQGNVKDAGSFLRKDSYDVVVVNPPYFKAPAGHKLNPDRSKAIARHELEINLEEIIAVSNE